MELTKGIMTESDWEDIRPKTEFPKDQLEFGVSPDQLRGAVSELLDLTCIYDVSCEGLKKSDITR